MTFRNFSLRLITSQTSPKRLIPCENVCKHHLHVNNFSTTSYYIPNITNSLPPPPPLKHTHTQTYRKIKPNRYIVHTHTHTHTHVHTHMHAFTCITPIYIFSSIKYFLSVYHNQFSSICVHVFTGMNQ